MDHDDEVLLVARAKQGDIEAFEALYELHKTAIYCTAWRSRVTRLRQKKFWSMPVSETST